MTRTLLITLLLLANVSCGEGQEDTVVAAADKVLAVNHGIADIEGAWKIEIEELTFSSSSLRKWDEKSREYTSKEVADILEGLKPITEKDLSKRSIPILMMHGGGRTKGGMHFIWRLFAGQVAIIHFSGGGEYQLASP